MKLNKKTIYISLFTLLYVSVAFVSGFHAISFFGLANTSWLAVLLACTFEIGQAATLFSILTSPKERKKVMPWVLMTMFTLVQVIGNIFSSYKYLMLNSTEDLKYFKEPIFVWTDLPDNITTVLVVYLIGAILPISALLLTSMVTNYLGNDDKHIDKKSEDHTGDEVIKDEHIEEHTEDTESEEDLNEIEETVNAEVEEEHKETIDEKPEIQENETIKEDKKSHFLNL